MEWVRKVGDDWVVRLDEADLAQAKYEAMLRNAAAQRRGARDDHPLRANLTQVGANIVGRAGELAVAWALGTAPCPPVLGIGDDDLANGVQVRCRRWERGILPDLQIKCSDRKKAHLPFVLAVVAHRPPGQVHAYMKLRGWYYGLEGMNPRFLYTGDKYPGQTVWFVKAEVLHPMTELEELLRDGREEHETAPQVTQRRVGVVR